MKNKDKIFIEQYYTDIPIKLPITITDIVIIILSSAFTFIFLGGFFGLIM